VTVRAPNRTVRLRLYMKRPAHRRVIDWINAHVEREGGRTLNEALVQALVQHIQRDEAAAEGAGGTRGASARGAGRAARMAPPARSRELTLEQGSERVAGLDRARGILDGL
jgi:hypothetical protein